MLISPRLHLFEINDQSWWPQLLREKVQDSLALLWKVRTPVIQSASAAEHAAITLSQVLGPRLSDYIYVDFASGAGGPTPYIERKLNSKLRTDGKEEVKFVLTDLKPHLTAWSAASKKSDNLSYISQGVDASNVQQDLLKGVEGAENKKVMRLFNLAFHHFDDDLATKILENTIESSSGFCIFELQSRDISSLITITALWPALLFLTITRFSHSPAHLFFTYIIPLIPFVVCYDGYISCLRTRTPVEVQTLLSSHLGRDGAESSKKGESLRRWKFMSGEVMHTWPTGWMNWIICIKEDADEN